MAVQGARNILTASKLGKGVLRRHLEVAAWRHVSTSSRLCGGHGHGHDHGHHPPSHGGEFRYEPIKCEIGKREIVGYGMNGEENYIDDVHAPFPAIRFREDTPEILKLREKEKGDWKKLTIAEKKVLYRASFCQTIAEVVAPTGEWKKCVGIAAAGVAIGIWGYMWCKKFVYGEVPYTVTDEEYLKAEVKRLIDYRVGPIEGFTSNYDYEKGKWKN
jgi:cytochrome c oxidase subunit 4